MQKRSGKFLRERANRVFTRLEGEYPGSKCTLEFCNPLQLLVATQLAAQCTDKRVNMVTPDLFERYKTAADYAGADIAELEGYIRPTGFYRNKAANIKSCCMILESRYSGRVPSDMDALLELPGVGRKTANVVRGEAYGLPGVVVDTHAGRISSRLGLTRHKDPVKIEFDLMDLLPRDRWNKFCHLLIDFGRDICKARNPNCSKCLLKSECEQFFDT